MLANAGAECACQSTQLLQPSACMFLSTPHQNMAWMAVPTRWQQVAGSQSSISVIGAASKCRLLFLKASHQLVYLIAVNFLYYESHSGAEYYILSALQFADYKPSILVLHSTR